MAASNNNSSNNNINNRSLVGDNGQDDNNNSFGKDPGEKKNINKAGNGSLADDNAAESPDGEETVQDTVEEVGEKAAPLPDDDVEMEDMEQEPAVINDITKAIQVALEGHNGEMARKYPDAVLRGYTAMFPDGTKNMFLALVGDTVKDVNDKLDKYFGEDAVFLGFVDDYRVIRATPRSFVHEIVGLSHIKLGFGFGADTPDDGD